MFRGEDDESKKLEKPKFPDITEKTELYNLIKRNSPEFFTIIGVDNNWLQTPMEEWDKSDAFNSLPWTSESILNLKTYYQ